MTSLTLSSAVESEANDQAGARPKASKDGVRFDLAQRSMDCLNVLKVKSAAAWYAEVVRNASGSNEALIEATGSGKQFLVRDEHGVLSPCRLFF